MKDNHQLSGFLAEALPKYAMGIGIIGIALSALGFISNPERFYFSYLTAFMFFLTISLGAFFFIIIQHLVRSGWSVVVRRIPEQIMANLPIMALFFIPILAGIPTLFEWSHASHVMSSQVLQAKSGYLNVPFFLIRAVFYFGVWTILSRSFLKRSLLQDKTGDETLTLKSQTMSTYGVLLFAITLTFSAIDWVMSLTPHWFSTMFGVYIFAGSIVSALATISLIAMLLRKFGFLKELIRVDHYHDIGKLLYGFNVFWAYIAFSQYFLIWYANIPEETVWFIDHFKGSWNSVGVFLAIGHFGIPFLFFMSRHAKRNLKFHAIMAVWFLIVHYVDLYWIIMPNINKFGIAPSWIDLAALMGIGGVCISLLFNRLKKSPLYPLKDPRLEDSKHLEVV